MFYGSSECGGISFDRKGDAAERGSVGEPMEGVRIDLRDAEDGTGIVTVESEAVAIAYFPDTGSGKLGDGRFETEDLARLRDGELYLEGRRGDWINVKGKKVNPREVESVLEQHEALAAKGEDTAHLQRGLKFNYGGHVNHELYWLNLCGKAAGGGCAVVWRRPWTSKRAR